MAKEKIKLHKDFLPKLHQLIYDNSKGLISLAVDRECKKFIKELEKFDTYYT